jgi:SAM-dependent methyltransferase
MIEQCNKTFPDGHRTHFAVSDVTGLPFPDGFFDAVTCLRIIDRITNYPSPMREMARVLKENGTLIVAVGNLLSPGAFWRSYIYNPFIALLRPFYYGLLRKPRKPAMSPVARLPCAGTYRKLAALSGCVASNVVYFNFDLLPSPLNEWFPSLAVSLADKAEELRFGKLKWLGQGFLLKATNLPQEG